MRGLQLLVGLGFFADALMNQRQYIFHRLLIIVMYWFSVPVVNLTDARAIGLVLEHI